MQRAWTPVQGAVPLGRCLLFFALFTAVAAMHLLSADGRIHLGAMMTASGAERPVETGSRSTEPAQAAEQTGAADQIGIAQQAPPRTGSFSATSIAAAVASEGGMITGAHLQGHHGPGDCTLFLAGGSALVVLMSCATARARRRWGLVVARWMQVVASIAPRRGPPLLRWPRIALCVLRV